LGDFFGSNDLGIDEDEDEVSDEDELLELVGMAFGAGGARTICADFVRTTLELVIQECLLSRNGFAFIGSTSS
jgi:hypothetical protein